MRPSLPPLRRLPPSRALAVAVAATVALVVAVALDLSPYLRGPAPWPPDWRWRLRDGAPEHGLPAAVLFAAALLGLLAAATRPALERASRVAVAGLLAAATLGSLGFTIATVAMVEGNGAVDVLVQRTLSRGFTSYHSVAVSEPAADVGQFLADFEDIRLDLPVHAGAHPPGPVLYFRLIHGAVLARPEFAAAVARRARELGFEHRPRLEPPTEAELASATLGVAGLVLITHLSLAALYAFARALGASRRGSLVVALLLAVQPSFALVTPSFDKLLLPQQLALSALLALAFLPGTAPGRRYAYATLAGLCAGTSLFGSYGSAVFLVTGGALALAAGLARGARLAVDVLPPAAVAVGVAVLAFLAPLLVGYAPVSGLLNGLDAHGVVTGERTYAAWLVYNLWEVFVFAGPAAVVLCVARAARGFGELRAQRALRGLEVAPFVALTLVALVVALDVSGAVQGETGRVWAPMMPYVLVGALLDREGDGSERPLGATLAVGACLAATCLALRWFWSVP